MTYRAPVDDMLFMMRHVGGLDRAIRDGLHPDLSIDLVGDILGGQAERVPGRVSVDAAVIIGLDVVLRGTSGQHPRASVASRSSTSKSRCICMDDAGSGQSGGA